MSQQSIRMLSIDDRMLTSELDRAGYRNMGIHVRQVSSFTDAQDILSSELIDIIVINLDFEKIDALAICKHFKNKSETNTIPVIVTSVQTAASIRNAAIGAGADLFVEQPLPRQFFVEKLKKLLDQITRGTDRINHQEKVTLTYEGKDYSFPIGDLSATGMLVATEFEIPDNSSVSLSFLIPGNRKPISVKGTIVRKIDGDNADRLSGIGVRFSEFLGDSEKRLEKYVAKTADKDGKMLYYL